MHHIYVGLHFIFRLFQAETQAELTDVASRFVEAAQTGSLAESSNLTVTDMKVELPEPITVDPTGGVRMDNVTG